MKATQSRIIVTPCLSLALFAATSFSVGGQQLILNGDFSSGLDYWTLVQPPGNMVVAPQPGSFDIASSGPLSTDNEFYAHIGSDFLIDLQQPLSLSGGITYNFYAGIASSTPQYNVDNGTISVFIDGNSIASYSFGGWSDTVTSISGVYTPLESASAVLSIDVSRNYIVSGYSPTDWIDNISLTAIPEPSCLGLGVCGSILFWFKWRNAGRKSMWLLGV